MFKSFLLIFVFISSFGFSQDVYNKTDLEQMHIIGKAKMIKSDYYEGENINGNITKKPGCYISAHTITTFNTKGNKINTFYFNYKGIYFSKDTSIYDFRDNPIICKIYSVNGQYSTNKTFYKYDDKYNVIEKTYFITDSSKMNKTTYKYDLKGNIIEQLEGNDLKNTYKYDNQGNILEASLDDFTPRGWMNTKFYYEYFDKRKRILRTQYQSGTFSRQIIDSYDENGNIIEENTCTNMVEDFQKTLYSYEFDKRGNWIKMTGYRGKKYTATIREIEYY